MNAVLDPSKPQTLFSGYIHSLKPGQKTIFEYGNMSNTPQTLTPVLLSMDGKKLGRFSPPILTVSPGSFVQMDTEPWLQQAGVPSFQGQLLLVIRNTEPPTGPKIAPAVTARWQSTQTLTDVGAQGFERLNTTQSIGRTSFFMFCPVVIHTPERTTQFILLNHSTEPFYKDSVKIKPVLWNSRGEERYGKGFEMKAFGAAFIDLVEQFGEDVGEFLLGTYGTVGITHVGHVFPSYFLHVDRKTGNVLGGQHTQPPANVLSAPGVWWGKLRQLIV